MNCLEHDLIKMVLVRVAAISVDAGFPERRIYPCWNEFPPKSGLWRSHQTPGTAILFEEGRIVSRGRRSRGLL